MLVVSTHVVQYGAPFFRVLADRGDVDVLVAYLSEGGLRPHHDPGFQRPVAWDLPLRDGYPHVFLPNRAPRPGPGRFTGYLNPGLWGLVRRGRFDAVVAYGYASASMLLALAAARSSGTPFVLATDATTLARRDGSTPAWKAAIVPRLYRAADLLIAPSTATRRFLLRLGLPEDRVVLAPYAVDNAHFAQAASGSDPRATRMSWGVPPGAPVALFAGKLVAWKRPEDLLHALAEPGGRAWHAVFAGDGPLRASLEALAARLGVASRSHFLGFQNQSAMPPAYAASDLLVLPSGFEPFGLVVNEAMAAGVPAAVSDAVGARWDLVEDGRTGAVFPVGDPAALAKVLGYLEDPAARARLSAGARARIATWSYAECAEGYASVARRARALRIARGSVA